MVWKIYSVGGKGLHAKHNKNILLGRNRCSSYRPLDFVMHTSHLLLFNKKNTSPN